MAQDVRLTRDELLFRINNLRRSVAAMPAGFGRAGLELALYLFEEELKRLEDREAMLKRPAAAIAVVPGTDAGRLLASEKSLGEHERPHA